MLHKDSCVLISRFNIETINRDMIVASRFIKHESRFVYHESWFVFRESRLLNINREMESAIRETLIANYETRMRMRIAKWKDECEFGSRITNRDFQTSNEESRLIIRFRDSANRESHSQSRWHKRRWHCEYPESQTATRLSKCHHDSRTAMMISECQHDYSIGHHIPTLMLF